MPDYNEECLDGICPYNIDEEDNNTDDEGVLFEE